MAENENTTFRADLEAVIHPVFALKAMLQGAECLLEGYAGEDREGVVWAAREIVREATIKAESIYMRCDDLDIYRHADELEAARSSGSNTRSTGI